MQTFNIFSTKNDSGNGQGDFIITLQSWSDVEDYCSRKTGHYYITGPHDDMVTMLSYRSRLEWLIGREHVTMYRLAARAELNESTIRKYVNGTTNALKMPLENAHKIAAALEMTIDELYELLA